jgi:hypothetical protein
MSQLSNRNNLSPKQRQRLGRIGQIVATIGAALAGVYLMTSVNEVTTMEHCDTCTETITGQQGGNLSLRDGDVLCITATGHFNGNLNLQGRNDTIRIVNEGILNPNNLNLNQGYYAVENHAIFNLNAINYNSADYARIVNEESGQMQVQTFNLRNEGIFDNAGTFTAQNMNMSGSTTFNNDSSGSVSTRQLQVNGGSTVSNFGQWDITQNSLTLNNGSNWTNGGTLTIARDLTVNSSSELANTGTMDISQDFTINGGEIDNRSTIDVGRNFILNGGGTMYHSNLMVVNQNFTVGGTLRGPSDGNYGSITVDGRSTLYSNAQVEDNIDICDSGQPSDGVDDRWGTPGPDVTYCVHTAGSPPNNLPVELTDFRAKVEGGQVNLRWETASELNNHFFTVERSRGDRSFEAVGQVDGVGTTSQAQRYQYQDRPNETGTYYYRLKQTDFDGSSQFSPIVEVHLTTEAAQSQLKLYPNPATDQTNLRLHLPQATALVVQISTANGQIVQRTQQPHQGGVQSMRLDLSDLAPGMYLVQVFDPSGRPVAAAQKLIRR